MKIVYNVETDTLTITLREERIRESDEVRPGVIADFGYDGQIVRLDSFRIESSDVSPGHGVRTAGSIK